MIRYKLYLHYLRLKHIRGNKNKVNFLNRNWDYAIVLDACRYDTFKELYESDRYKDIGIYGKLSKMISPASHTIDWIKYCMKEEHKDMILLTTSPHFDPSRLKKYKVKNCFYKIKHLWKNYYNEKLGVVHPESMIDAFNITKMRYPDKRIILWFMQPHRPYIINKEKSWTDYHKLKDTNAEEINYEDIEKSYEAYVDNLYLVMKVIKNIIPKMKGKVIITSDHGNLFGKYNVFLHPRMLRVPELVEVPYLEVDNN